MILEDKVLIERKGQEERLIKYKDNINVQIKNAINLMAQKDLYINILNSSIQIYINL